MVLHWLSCFAGYLGVVGSKPGKPTQRTCTLVPSSKEVIEDTKCPFKEIIVVLFHLATQYVQLFIHGVMSEPYLNCM